jgi:hypothetical protein
MSSACRNRRKAHVLQLLLECQDALVLAVRPGEDGRCASVRLLQLENRVRIGVSPSPDDSVLPLAYDPLMARKERDILKHAVHAVAEQAAKADT